jgi:hypothetical protein
MPTRTLGRIPLITSVLRKHAFRTRLSVIIKTLHIFIFQNVIEPYLRFHLKSRKEENRENNEHLLPKPLTSNCYDQTGKPPKHGEHACILLMRKGPTRIGFFIFGFPNSQVERLQSPCMFSVFRWLAGLIVAV